MSLGRWIAGLMMPTNGTLPVDAARVRLLASGVVMAEPGRCVECGTCNYNCPAGIDVRAVARQGLAVTDGRCLLCGSCVTRCPRGTLQFHELEVVW